MNLFGNWVEDPLKTQKSIKQPTPEAVEVKMSAY